MLNFNAIFGPADASSSQIPPKMLANEFGEVSIRRVGDRLQVAAAVAMGAFIIGDGERCYTGLALDGSLSMKDGYGRGSTLSPEDSKRLFEAGLYEEVVRDGVVRRVVTQEAKEEAKRMGLVKRTPNIVQAPAVKMVENVIRTFATGGGQSGSCEVIYWACGNEGKEVERLGEISMADLPHVKFEGPQTLPFGPHTHLGPPFKYFAQRARNLSGVFVFVTDGHIDDEDEVVRETHRLATEMAQGGGCSIKCVLLGIGRQVDVNQLNRIDDMEMPPDLASYDVWNSKVLAEMRDMSDAWSEIFDPETEIASRATIYDDKGQVVYQETDSVKALVTFEMPADSKYFDVVVEGDMKIHQPLPD